MHDDVEKYFLPGHRSRVTVCEAKDDALTQLAAGGAACVPLEPSVSFCHGELKFTKVRCRVSIRGCISVLLAEQVGLKDAVNDIDVVERTHSGA